MLGKTHRFVGITLGITAVIALGNPECLFGNLEGILAATGILAGSWFGSLFPDIDMPSSLMGRKIPIIPKIINKLFGHRNGFTHSRFGAALTSLVLLFALLPISTALDLGFFFGFLIGFISHLVLDGCTPLGVPLFYQSNFGLVYSIFNKYFHIDEKGNVHFATLNEKKDAWIPD